MTAWKAKHPNPSGKTPLIFSPNGAAQSDAPINIACNQCIGCRLKRAQDWAIRLTHEAQYHEKSIFITLTFTDQKLAIRDNPGSIDVRDVQRFIKRLRIHLTRKEPNHTGRIRYYSVGEYGEKTGRPHYHILLFGFRPNDAVKYKASRKGSILYNSKLLTSLWPYGYSNFGDVTWNSASYCAGYITKKIHDNSGDRLTWIDPITGEIKPKEPEFSTMSRDPPLGQQWIEENYKDAFTDDYIVINGKKRSIPRSYDEWLEKHDPDWLQELKDKRQLEFRELPHITEDRRLDMHLARWHHHSQRLREETDDHETRNLHDIRQQSKGIPKAILHAQRRYRAPDD